MGDCRHPVTSMMRDNVYTYDWIFIELGFLGDVCEKGSTHWIYGRFWFIDIWKQFRHFLKWSRLGVQVRSDSLSLIL